MITEDISMRGYRMLGNRNNVGKTKEVNTKRDDYCVYQFNKSAKQEQENAKAIDFATYHHTDYSFFFTDFLKEEDVGNYTVEGNVYVFSKGVRYYYNIPEASGGEFENWCSMNFTEQDNISIHWINDKEEK